MKDDRYKTYHEVLVPVSPHEAFHLFVERLAAWWPKEYTWSQDELDDIYIEAKEGGRCSERGPLGFQMDWGRVVACEPPQRVVFTWQIGFDRVPQPSQKNASEVEVRFLEDSPTSTRLLLEHRNFQNHGAGAAEYCGALASKSGWPFILEQFAKKASARST